MFKASAELQAEVSNSPLTLTGSIPDWLSGTLVRNGPVTVTVNGQSNLHFFDGLAMLHGFTFHQSQVHYSNQFLRTDAYRAVFEKGSLQYEGFAIDPCRSLFKNFFTWLLPHHPSCPNANVNVAKFADQYVALTEIPLPVRFDPETLNTLGVFDYQDQLPKEKCWESAHPHTDYNNKETINYLIQFGRKSFYVFHRLKDSRERKVIAKIPVEEPSYMHSFALTNNYLILTQYPFVVKPLDLIIKGQAFIKNFSWKPEKGTQFLVIDRHNGSLVRQYRTDPFFAFHHANAFEEGNTLHLDIVCFEDVSIIANDLIYFNSQDTLDPAKQGNCSSRLKRFSLSLETGKISSQVLFSRTSEFPRINGAFDGLPYRYLYLTGFVEKPANMRDVVNGTSLYKVDTHTKQVLEWSETGCSPGEPVFVAAPNPRGEDEGVVLTIVLDSSHQRSFLLLLDGKSFKEIGRAIAPYPIPPGLHAQYFESLK